MENETKEFRPALALPRSVTPQIDCYAEENGVKLNSAEWVTAPLSLTPLIENLQVEYFQSLLKVLSCLGNTQ